MIRAQPTKTEQAAVTRRHITRLHVSDAVAYAAMLAMASVFLIPIFWMLVTSLKEMSELYNTPTLWFGHGFAWHNYRDIFDYVPFTLYFRNTAIIVVAAEIGGIASAALVAYAFAWMR